MAISPVYANSSNQIAALKELYKDPSEVLKDMVYTENPTFALMAKDESIDGLAGKYFPIPIQYGTPQGRAHPFANAQNQQTAPQLASYFVYVISDYTVVTITNLLMEQTRTNAGAFIDESKLIVDGGFRTAANNVAFELFGDGSGTRGFIGSTVSAAPTYTITLSNAQQVVNFEVGQNLVNYAYTAGVISAISATTGYVQAVDRAAGILTIVASATDASWATAGNALGVFGDIQAGAVNTGTSLCMSGLAAWIPLASPGNTDSFWGVNRSFDPTRLAGLRSVGTADPIDVAITNALAFLNREGGKPDLAIMDFFSYAALVNALGKLCAQVKFSLIDMEALAGDMAQAKAA